MMKNLHYYKFYNNIELIYTIQMISHYQSQDPRSLWIQISFYQ